MPWAEKEEKGIPCAWQHSGEVKCIEGLGCLQGRERGRKLGGRGAGLEPEEPWIWAKGLCLYPADKGKQSERVTGSHGAEGNIWGTLGKMGWSSRKGICYYGHGFYEPSFIEHLLCQVLYLFPLQCFLLVKAGLLPPCTDGEVGSRRACSGEGPLQQSD